MACNMVLGDSPNGDLTQEIASALAELRTQLAKRIRADHIYELPSQAEASEAQVSMAGWVASGNDGAPPDLTAPAFRAAIYDFARPAAQLRAYRQIVSVALLEHVDEANDLLKADRFLLGFACLRGIFERAGILSDLLRRLNNRIPEAEGDFKTVLGAGEIIGRTLYGTRVAWKTLAAAKFTEILPSDLEYAKVEGRADMSAKSILTGIDVLNKSVPGARAAYAVLCEFLHPNVGDIVSSTVRSTSFNDAYGTRHIRREIGQGRSNLSTQIDIRMVVASALKVAADVTNAIPAQLAELDAIASRVSQLTERAQHKIVKLNRNVFSRGDPCPCLSGKSIRQCAPLALKGSTARR